MVPLTEEQAKKLQDRTFNLCVWHLGQSAKTVAQLREKMNVKKVPEDIQEAVLARLDGYGYVNDRSFAEQFTRSRVGSARKGVMAVRQELRRKGVDSETIEEVLDEVDPEIELENARTLVERKLRSSVGLERRKRVNRLVAMLARKGYPAGMAYRVVNEALDAEGDDDEDEVPVDTSEFE